MALKMVLNMSEPVASLDHYVLVLTLISWFNLIHFTNYKIIWLVSRGSLLFKLAWCRLASLEIIYTTSSTSNEPCDWTHSSPLNMNNMLKPLILYVINAHLTSSHDTVLRHCFATFFNCGIMATIYDAVACSNIAALSPVWYTIFGLFELKEC